jgi:RNA polymerase sigma-70 factor, ECF subfamily
VASARPRRHHGVENLAGWFTTIVARVCLDTLRRRRSRREDPVDAHPTEPLLAVADGSDPEHQTLVAESVGPALLVVLDLLAPAERVEFVLHDIFAAPVDEIAPIVERSADATRQLASRARRRVQGTTAVPTVDLTRQREIVDTFLAASRDGDFDALLAMLDPDITLRADAAAVQIGAPRAIHGAAAVATRSIAVEALGATPG